MTGFRIGVQLVEITNSQCQIGVSKEFNRFGFGEAHEQGGDVFLEGAFLEKGGEELCFFAGFIVAGHDNARWIEIIVEGL